MYIFCSSQISEVRFDFNQGVGHIQFVNKIEFNPRRCQEFINNALLDRDSFYPILYRENV
jgi:hypothetical protein